MKKLWLLLSIAVLFLFNACSDDDPILPPGHSNAEGVFALSEGGYGKNNAALSYSSHDYTNQTQYAYRDANGDEILGGLGNHMDAWSDNLYIVCSNSNLIQIVNANDFKSVDSVKLGADVNPREIVVVDNKTAFVTAYSNGGEVLKIDLENKNIASRIQVRANPESIVECNNKLFVANSGWGNDSTVSVIDMASLQVTKTVNVGWNPNELMTDGVNVYAVATDKYFGAGNGSAGVYEIDGTTLEVVGYTKMPGNPSDGSVYKDGKLLVVSDEGLYLVNPDTKQTEKVLIEKDKVVTNGQSWSNIYAVYYSAKHDKIYCGNPKDFAQNGEVVVFDKDLAVENRINAGVNPGAIIVLN